MRLFLLRHAEASYDAPTDHDRELTPKGEKSIYRLTAFLKKKEFAGLRAIHHSGLVRARQTAEIFRDELRPEIALEESPHLAPMDDPRALGPLLQQAEFDLMLVGHNPNLSILTAWLLTGNARTDCIDFKKSGLLCLERGGPPNEHRPAGAWAINWYVVKRLTSKG